MVRKILSDPVIQGCILYLWMLRNKLPLFNLTKELRDLKKNGASRKQLLAKLVQLGLTEEVAATPKKKDEENDVFHIAFHIVH